MAYTMGLLMPLFGVYTKDYHGVLVPGRAKVVNLASRTFMVAIIVDEEEDSDLHDYRSDAKEDGADCVVGFFAH
jgi:hypothetical protein